MQPLIPRFEKSLIQRLAMNVIVNTLVTNQYFLLKWLLCTVIYRFIKTQQRWAPEKLYFFLSFWKCSINNETKYVKKYTFIEHLPYCAVANNKKQLWTWKTCWNHNILSKDIFSPTQFRWIQWFRTSAWWIMEAYLQHDWIADLVVSYTMYTVMGMDTNANFTKNCYLD